MTKLELYRLIRQNDALKDERHPMFDKNRFVRLLAVFMWLYYAALLLMMGVVLSFGMDGAYNGVAAFHVLDGFFPLLLVADFWVRFILQETPAMQCRQYALLPVRRSFLMNVYLTRSGFSLGNLYWFFFLVPFGLIAIVSHFGWLPFWGWLIGWWLMCVADGFAYLFVRTLCMKHLAWALLPLAGHGALLAVMFVPERNPLDMPCTEWLYAFSLWHPMPFVVMGGVIAFLFYANTVLQGRAVYDEVAGKEDVEIKSATQMNFLNRYGKVGEYLKLELKLRLRNKQVRLAFFMLLGTMVLLSGILDFTDIYDGGFMVSFICLYDYIVPGLGTLVTLMCYEGNYMDGLMSRRESVYDLLKAKYYFHLMLLVVPMVLLIPSMVMGKIGLAMNIGYLFFTAGVLYPLLFQTAVYNKETIPLNRKITGKQANVMQNVVSLAVLFIPIGLERLCVLLLGETWGCLPLVLVGAAGVATHRIWLRNLYRRLMQRRYINMEGFRASRE